MPLKNRFFLRLNLVGSEHKILIHSYLAITFRVTRLGQSTYQVIFSLGHVGHQINLGL